MKAAMRLRVMHRAGKLSDCLRELKRYFKTYALSSLE